MVLMFQIALRPTSSLLRIKRRSFLFPLIDILLLPSVLCDCCFDGKLIGMRVAALLGLATLGDRFGKVDNGAGSSWAVLDDIHGVHSLSLQQ